MKVEENSRSDVEKKIEKMGDYVKIDYLSSCLKNKLDFDTRRFVLMELTKLYEDKKMFSEAGRMIKAASDINTNDKGKVADLLKSTELFIKGKMFSEAETTVKRALSLCSESRKREIKSEIKEIYKTLASSYEKKDQRKNAAEVYTILLEFELDQREREDIYAKLLKINESLGRIKDYYQIKKLIEK